jgi:polyvinyl alcohol dehydrogenase (cytochrome)
MHARRSILAAAMVLAGAGMGMTFAHAVVDPPPPPPEAAAAAADGAAIYQRLCALCHEGALQKAPPRATLQAMTAGAIHQALDTGVMKVQAKSLSENERVAVAHYLSQVKEGPGGPASYGPPCRGTAAAFSAAAPAWAGWGIDLHNSRDIPATRAELSKTDLPRLQVDWVRAYPNALRARSQPGFAGGAAFIGSHDGTVYALDEHSGCVRWTFHAAAEVRTAIVVGALSSPSAQTPALFFGDLAGEVFALDAHSGHLLWRATPDAHPNATITATPVLYERRLYVAVSSLEVLAADDPSYSCCAFRGSVVAYDARSGRQLWQRYSVPDRPSPQKPNSHGVMQLGPSGAPVWGSPSIDAKRRRLYIGTGENYSSPAEAHSDAIMALDLDSGVIAWVHQVTRGDAWNGACTISKINCPQEDGPDADFGAATVFASTSDGRDLVLAGEKSGIVVALDPDSGHVVWQRRVGRGGGGGGIRFGMALEGDRLFVPTGDTPNDRHYPGPPQPGLYALDIRTGRLLWSSPSENGCEGQPQCRAGITAAITATGGMVLAGGRDGWFRIFDAEDGRLLWKFQAMRAFPALNGTATGGSFSGGAGPVVHGGRIYLNSGYGFGADVPGNLLLTLHAAADKRGS